MSSTLSTSDRALIAKYVLEAHSKERQLETALQAQIGLAKSPLLEHALIDHLAVTRRQIGALQRRLTELGEEAESGPVEAVVETAVETVAGAVSTVANKGLALAKGPLQALRGTSMPDNEIRNIRDCYWNEAEEIAHYRVIEAVAEQIGDTQTAELARAHRKEEEEMQTALEGLLPGVVRTVVERESPGSAAPRPAPTRAATSGGGTATAGKAKSTAGKAGSRAKTKAAGTRAGTAAKAKAAGSSTKRNTAASKAGATTATKEA